MLHCNIAGAHYVPLAQGDLPVSKQLTLSAALSVAAMASFALLAAREAPPTDAKGAPTGVAAPAFEASLPGS